MPVVFGLARWQQEDQTFKVALLQYRSGSGCYALSISPATCPPATVLLPIMVMDEASEKEDKEAQGAAGEGCTSTRLFLIHVLLTVLCSDPMAIVSLDSLD